VTAARGVRTAVIVAAGRGSRLAAAGTMPKPLMPAVRVPLIARILRAAAASGIDDVRIVVGHRADEIRAAVPGLAPPGCRITFVDNPRYDEPNGVSLLAGASAIEGPFVLLMADHLFAPERLRAALARYEETGRPLLVVQAIDAFDGNLGDATKVRVGDGRVRALGKDLDRPDAVDTGMFVLDAAETTATLRAAGPSPSISAGMTRLAEAGRLDAYDPGVGWWQDVDDEADLAQAHDKLLTGLTKTTDGFLARHVNRRVSLWLTRRVWRHGVTPNQVTFAVLLLGLAAGWAFAGGAGVGWGLLGALLFQAHSILDGTDGELARLLHRESRFGFWFDVTADNLTHAAVFAGIALGHARDGVPPALGVPWAAVGGVAVAGVAAAFAVMAPFLAPGGAGPAKRDGRLEGLVDGLARRDFTWALFPLALLQWLGGFLWVAAAGTWAYAAVALALRARAARRTP
jgi:choline kinase/phosphatidylglycerophosphate synthase